MGCTPQCTNLYTSFECFIGIMIVDINIARNISKTIPSVQVFMHESTLTLPVFR
jgi:hypothetical protein